MDLSVFQWAIGALSAFSIGLAKAGIPGVSILAVPLMADAFGAKASVGLALPTLVTGDIAALMLYRRFARWRIILRVLPYTLVGILAGVALLGTVDDAVLRRSMGGMVLSLLLLQLLLRRWDIPGARAAQALGPTVGVLAGVTTAMANAAGPLVTVYLLWMDVQKEEFVGTAAWYFFTVNCFKVPFLIHLGLISAETVPLNVFAVPVVAVGALVGVLVLKRMDPRFFRYAVQGLAAVAAVRLLVG